MRGPRFIARGKGRADNRPDPFPTITIPIRQARAQLALLLAGATDAKLDGFTVGKLAALNRTPKDEIAEALAAEKTRRMIARARRAGL